MRLATIALILALPTTMAVAEPRILVYGDSNSWGWVPVEEGFPTTRYDDAVRWPGVLQTRLSAELGDVTVVVNALSGRTVAAAYPETQFGIVGPDFAGLSQLRASIARELPLDLVVIMLGTNDARSDLDLAPEDVAHGIGEMIDIIQNIDGGVATIYPAPRVLIVAPPHVGDTSGTPIDGVMQGAQDRSVDISEAILAEAASRNVAAFDAGTVVAVTSLDGVHFTPDMHQALGEAVATVAGPLLETAQ